MRLFNQPPSTARTALIYTTLGTLIVIWTGVEYIHLYNNPPETNQVYYWCTGFLVTGLAMVFIGLVVGWLGRSDRIVSQVSEEVPVPVVNPQPAVAVPAPVVAARTNSTAPLVVPNGQILASPPQQAAGREMGSG